MSYFKLYWRYLAIQLKSAMQYKASFAFTVLGQLLASFSTFAGIYFMFTGFDNIDGFTYDEVLLCFSVMLFSFSLAECFARGFDTFAKLIGNGEFDRILVRPRNEIFQVLAGHTELSRIGRLIQAVIILAYCFSTSAVTWTAARALTVVLMVICGAAVFSALFLVYASFCFFTLDGLEFMNIFTDGGREFGRYPFAVYGKRVLWFFTFVVPLAATQYYPFLYVCGRSDDIRHMLAPLLSLLFIAPCYIFWRFGVRHFKSTGS